MVCFGIVESVPKTLFIAYSCIYFYACLKLIILPISFLTGYATQNL